MSVSPILRKMGFAASDRILIIHADDIGMSQATLPAFEQLIESGLVSCGSAMAPSSWFPQVAAWHRQNPDADLGIHLTLTSEWGCYRWGPISTRNLASGLVNQCGYFHQTVESLCKHANVDDVYAEMKAQVMVARQLGIEPTHIDTHMYACMEPRFISTYVGLGLEMGLPALIFRNGPRDWVGREKLISVWEGDGLPVFDNHLLLPVLSSPESYLPKAKELIDHIPRGLSCWLSHPALDTPELRAMVPRWRHRVAEHKVFSSPELLDYVQKSDVFVINFRQLRDAMTSAAGAVARSIKG